MVQPQIFQGTWEDFTARAEELRKHKNLLLIIPADEATDTRMSRQNDAIAQQSADARKAAQIAAIHAGMGKFRYNDTATEELHRERQADKEREEQQIRDYNR